MWITMTPISERQRAQFYIYIKQKNCKTFIYINKKSDTLQKSRQFPLFFIHKNLDTLRYAIFMKILKLAFIYIQKAQHSVLHDVFI